MPRAGSLDMRMRLGILALFLCACEQPSSATTVTVNLDTEPVVLTLTASEDDDTPQWDVYIDAASAPAGEYLVFGSTTPPTSDSALEGFDFTSCRTPAGVPRDCVVPGLGTFWGRTVLEADGKLTLWGSAGYGTVGTPY